MSSSNEDSNFETNYDSTQKVTEIFKETMLLWKHEQKNLVGNKVKSILIQRRLLTEEMNEIIDNFIDEVVDLSEH